MVAEQASMRPITVFRPFQEEVSAILALQPLSQNSDTVLLTLGRGYRSLIKRYKEIGNHTVPQNSNHTYALLWANKNWAAM